MSKYTADELYNLSATMGQYKAPQMHPILQNRVIRLLARDNSGLVYEGKPNRQRILVRVLDGSIWAVKGCGKVSIEQICKWLAMKDNTVLSEDEEK